MRKLILIILAIITMYSLSNKVGAEEVVIPDSAIRLRVIPNSNSTLDQNMKTEVKTYLEENVYNIFSEVKSIEEARTKINKEIPNIENEIENIFLDNNYNIPFKVNYGMNYFPEKEYKDIVYEEGYYESLVVEIGEAKGDNWWCVLFPPLCLIEADETNTTETEYKFFVKELIDKYLKK